MLSFVSAGVNEVSVVILTNTFKNGATQFAIDTSFGKLEKYTNTIRDIGLRNWTLMDSYALILVLVKVINPADLPWLEKAVLISILEVENLFKTHVLKGKKNEIYTTI